MFYFRVLKRHDPFMTYGISNLKKKKKRRLWDFLGGPVVKEKKMEVVGLCNWDE